MTVSYNNAGYQTLKPGIITALEELGKRHGVEFNVEGGRVGSDNLLFKVVMRSSDPAAREAAERKDFERIARNFGLEPSDYGLEFVSSGRMYRIVGLTLGRPKYPLNTIEVITGKRYKHGLISPDRLVVARKSRDDRRMREQFADMAQF